ncbi:MAG: acetate kinase [Thermodesulfobacteriota bacterium]|nr:acetate kinase [Thermodesulfobacteriota bacterium]
MKILVINTGSSSLKYHLFRMPEEIVLFEGRIDGIGLEAAKHQYRVLNREGASDRLTIPDQMSALSVMLETLGKSAQTRLHEIDGAAHRVGHGGFYRQAARITPDVMEELAKMVPFVPLHLPAMIREIELCMELMPTTTHVAVNDAWFHETIPDEAIVYGLPFEYFSIKHYKRVGYHGFSHAYVAERAAQYVGRPLEDLRIISCHLGNGASICAISQGRSVDTTMGMSALEGLIMGTRSGDVDPGLIPVIMKQEGLSPDQMLEMLYSRSGLVGLSGISRNMQDIERAVENGDERAGLAFRVFCHKVKRYIGAMLMVLGGCDVLVFTGGIGENSPLVRSKVLDGTSEVGFVVDEDMNVLGRPWRGEGILDITASASPSKILVIETFEELIMARQCAHVMRCSSMNDGSHN